MKTKTIVLIHGMFMTANCWENWIPRYEAKGYKVFAPAWPGREESVENLRKKFPNTSESKLTLKDVLDRYVDFIQTLEEKPAVIGHSMGGLIVQLLLQRNLVTAGVAIDPAPPMGIFTLKPSFFVANFPAINPFFINQALMMSFENFQYAFANTLTLEEQRAGYGRYMVPQSRRVPLQSLGPVAKVDFKKEHAPLLITAGEKDTIVPAALNRTNFNAYKSSKSITEFKMFDARDHFLICSKGWEEVADYSLNWLEKN